MPQPSPTGPDREAHRGEPFEGAGSGGGGGRKWGALGLLIALAGAYCIYEAGVVGGHNDQSPLPVTAAAGPAVQLANPKVFVTGRVRHPGVYSLSPDSRVQDAIDRAGGTLPGADTDALNLAAWVADGSKIIVPAKGSPPPHLALGPRSPSAPNGPDNLFPPVPQPLTGPEAQALPTRTKRRRKRTVSPGVIANGDGIQGSTGSNGGSSTGGIGAGAPNSSPAPFVRSSATALDPSPTPDGTPKAKRTARTKKSTGPVDPVDLNRGTPEQLEALPGVGPKMAARIAAYRAANGPYRNVDELDQVAGIGPKKLEKMRPYLVVR